MPRPAQIQIVRPKDGLFVERRVDKVKILLIHLLFRDAQSFAKALEVYDLTLTQEFDDVIDIRIIAQPQDVVISNPGFLLSGQILRQIGDQIAFTLSLIHIFQLTKKIRQYKVYGKERKSI